MSNDKMKITQKEFDDMYQIEEITEESNTVPLSAKPLDDTTPTPNPEESILTDEELASEVEYLKDYQTPEEELALD